MRIGYLVSQYPASNHTFILREILGLRERGFDIHVISIRGADRAPAAMTAEERSELERTAYVKPRGVFRIALDHAVMLLSRPRQYLRGVRAALALGGSDPMKVARSLFYFVEAVVVGRWMRRRQLTHLHTHFSLTVAYLVKETFGVDISATIHGPAEFDDVAGAKLGQKLAACTFVCAISEYGRSQIMLASDPSVWPRVHVVRLGVATARYVPNARRWQPADGTFELVMVGRLAPVKAQRLLVDVVAALRAEGRDVRLTLVGGGPDADALQRMVQDRALGDRVVLTGPLNQDRVREIYERSDCFVLGSFAEGIPVVLMEAMAMGIPCVATRITGIPELITGGVEGLLVSPGSAEELATAIRVLMDDAALRARVREAGRAKVEAAYDLVANTAKLAQVFRERLVLRSSAAA